MAGNVRNVGDGLRKTRMYYHIVVLLLLQFLFKFAQGNGPGHFTVFENRPPGTAVGTISTEIGHTYTIYQDSLANDYFLLDSENGKITTRIIIDREVLQLTENKFDILILDQSSSGNKPVEISIEILDENDNNPYFPSENINVTFRENVQIGFPNYISTAADNDIGSNAQINSYEIKAGTGPFQLVFDPEQFGDVLILQTTGKLDREINSSYTLVIVAVDGGSPSRTGTTTVSIWILDENDNPPIFDPSTYRARINETEPKDTFVIKVAATDRDFGVNQDVTYELVDVSAETDQFRIDAATGEIFTTKEPLFCHGDCLVTVESRDHGVPSYTGRAFVYITVIDTNNHDPTIKITYVPTSNTEFSSINEDAVNTTIAAGIQTFDGDAGIYGQTSAAIISGNELNHFRLSRIVPGAYYIHVNGDNFLDRERHSVYNLTVQAKDNGNPPRTTIKALIIYVNDINDHAPVFVNKKVSLMISETTEQGSFIASMLATDADEGINAKLTYKIESGNQPDWFHLNEETGLVTTQTRLHYQDKHYFKMNISVHDGALNPLRDYAELEISIWDENDIPPTFAKSVFEKDLDENLVSGAPVENVVATDYDSGDNGTVTYAFHPHVNLMYPNTFHLNTNNGGVTTTKSLDREDIAYYIIKVIATDGGPAPLTATATINLKVNDVNDNSPIFYPKTYYAKVIEGQGQDVEIVKVTATDLDEGINAEIVYGISGSSSNRFSIDSSNGSLKATEVLRKADGSSYTLTVTARDKFGQKTDTATVIVSVLSPTDLPPYFTSDSYSFKIPEDSTNSASHVGNNVGTVNARSDNPQVSISYKISAGDPYAMFSINTNSGQLRRAKAIDREMFASFSLTIIATSGNMFVDTIVTIDIQDSNDNAPSFGFPYIDIDLVENWPVGHQIAIINASDPDAIGPNSRIAYSLLRDQSNMFGIDSNTGLFFLKKPVQLRGSDSIILKVVATDSGVPQNTAEQELRLTFKDVNNHTPKFGHTTYELSLIESYPVNSRFYDVGAVDGDFGKNGQLVFNITRGNEDKKFGIFPDGNLYIAKELDRETKDLYKLGIKAHDRGMVPRTSECNITVHITDFNDNKPIFLNATYSFSVLENTAPGAYVGHVKASDRDMGRNSELSYFFNASENNFKIDSQTGEIVTLKSFDRESLDQNDPTYTLDVTVKDNGFERLTDIATIRVTIRDKNDNPPTFSLPVYKVSVFENVPTFSNITVVRAEDADSGINSVITYAIIDGNEDGNFNIGQTSGQITLSKSLDRESVDNYKLTIKATDSGATERHSTTTVVRITVNDINDNFPMFAQSHLDINVKEDVEPGSMIAYFVATDVDLGVNGEITYTMSGRDHDHTFGVDTHTGKIYLLKRLDYETKKNYVLNVTATDNGVPRLPYYMRFTISIEDVNDNHPVFKVEPLVFHILENSTNSLNLVEVQATDADSDKNGEVQYQISYQEPPGDHFKIVRSTGQIFVNKAELIDREVVDMFTVTVVATDQAEDPSDRLSTETRVTIYIDDRNDNDPMITSMNTVAVPLTTPGNEFLATITATDKDIGENGRISLQLLQNGGNSFGLESKTGRFYLSQSLSVSPVKYSLTVQANDYGTPNPRSSQSGLTVIITDDSEGPVFQAASYSGSVLENSDAGKSILTVLAISRKSSQVEYYVTNVTVTSTGRQTGRHFQVDKTTGVLSTASILDREAIGDEFDVEIYAIDRDGNQPRTSMIKARVQLIDVNDTPPRFSQSYYSWQVDEDVHTGFTINKVAVYDDDTSGGLHLTLDTDSNINLKVNQDGSLVTTGPLDRETHPRFTLRITATDGVQTSTCIVRLNVLDKNDNKPQFTRSFYSYDVDEDTAIGTTIGSVRAHDPDEGVNGHVFYSLLSGWGNDTFGLDPVKGTITLQRVLHFEETQLYTLEVRANDGGDPVMFNTVIVYFNVKDTNDKPPLFEHGTYNSAIYENVTIGTSVVEVKATDVDSGINGRVSYTISDGDYQDQFTIDMTSGAIYTAGALDRETTDTYTLVVMATDMADDVDYRKSSTAEVIITIYDVNDFTPMILSPAIIHVRENTPDNVVVHTILVRDLDEGVNRQVMYQGYSPTGQTPFTIGLNDGKLRVNTDLDREAVQNYTMIVTVTDKGTPKLSTAQTLIIKIEDENDHSPVFSPEYYEKTVAEDVAIGTTLLPVSATDQDAGLNGIVKYFILSGDDNYDFSMDQSSGVIRVQKSLDYERVSQYSLVIQAEDSGDDTRYSTATVSITVLDVNDNEPLFFDSPYYGFVRENMDILPVHVLNVSARDDDSHPYNQLSYSIREGNKDIFSMDPTTGEIKALMTLNREEVSEYILTVVATDSARRGLTGTGTVSVFVEDVNDNPPIFEDNGTYMAHIAENSADDSEVIVVKATDLDEGVNAQIIYSLRDSIQGKFTVFPDTGLIATTGQLDREEVSEYTLEVIAMDTSMLPLSSTTMVMVYIDDVNDNPPIFDKESYTRTVMMPANDGDFIVGVTASDGDIGDNGLVVYSISQTDSQYFTVDRQTGIVTVTQSLTTGRTYSFLVTASDKGTQALSNSVPVTITTTSSSGVTLPTFNNIPSDLKVIENLKIDQTITTITARASNQAAITYRIVGGNTGGAFDIKSSSGRIFVTGEIDYEATTKFDLWVEAEQGGNIVVSNYAKVLISVQDENDNDPRFTETMYNTSIYENVKNETSVVTMTAIDADSDNNGKVTYSLSGQDEDKFKIDPVSGKIVTFTDIDRELLDIYSVIVVAKDNGMTPRSSTASVRINVLDINDESPVFTRPFRVTVPENKGVGSFVLRVTSSDNDIGANAVATYSLIDDADGMFYIDSTSGNITLSKPLNAETDSSYRLRVEATDNGAHSQGANVEVEVSDVNDNNPIITAPLSFNFAEMEPVGTFVGQLKATDADISSPNNKSYFSLKLASSYFHLDSDSGNIMSLEELTFDPKMDLTSLPNRHELVVIAKDLGTPVKSSEETVYINVVDYNDYAPEFEQTSYRTAVPDTVPVDGSIIQLAARDEHDYGENAEVEYFVTGGNGTNLFKVHRFLGIVSVASQLSFSNRNKEYVIIVKAEDKGTPSQSTTVNVNLVVTSANINTPTFVAPASKQITIPENKAMGSLIETFSARDNDQGLNAEIQYEIASGNEEGLFEIDLNKGTLSVKNELDYETTHEFTLDITAKDKGLYSKSTTIAYLVRLSDVNDNDPMFGQTVDIIFVDENTPKESSVYHALAVDLDTDNNNAAIQYAIVEGSQTKFHIDGSSGILTVIGDLDYETEQQYSLTIMAMNPDSVHKSTMSLTIYVEGINEFTPRFDKDSYSFSISESAETKTFVGKVAASDNDAGEDGIVYYFLIGDSNAKGFKIDARSGNISVSGRPDYESSPRITLEVLAKNWGSVKGNDTDTCTVHISVQDANDPPVFVPTSYDAYILESSGADVSVVKVTAEDYDFKQEDRTFSYTILSGNTENLFKINRQTGYISTTGSGTMDRESGIPVYNVTVGAIDTGSPPETGSATVRVHLTDVNDNGPEFVNFTAKVAEGQTPDTLVTTLRIYTTDPDDATLGNQGPYTYSKLGGTHFEYDYFEIKANGEVTTKRELDREANEEFIVPVIVKDNGRPKMSSTLSFKVSVSDINDEAPTPRPLTLFVSLFDGKYPIGSFGNVRPLDKDNAGNYNCSLSGNSSPFVINAGTCDLYLNNYPTSNSYTLQVSGDDGVHNAINYDVSVKITSFNNNTIDHSTIVQIADVTADNFMKNSYTTFFSAIRAIFENQDEVFVFGLMQQASGDLLLYLAVRQSSLDQYYSSAILWQRLTAAKNNIQSNAGIFILDVAYTSCGSKFKCQNSGECASHVTVSTTNQIADSEYQAFSNPTLNLDIYCICPPQFTGPDCTIPASQCGNTYCQNGGQCVTNGNKEVCQCPNNWTGYNCDTEVNNCDPSPCVRGQCKNTENGYVCVCPYGFWGDLCDQTSRGFSSGSYMEFPKLTELKNEIEVTFATTATNALLLYNPSSVLDSKAFIGLEIINGNVRFSVSLGTVTVTRVTINKKVNNGRWFKVRVIRNGDLSKVWVDSCPDNGGSCDTCQSGSDCYGEGRTQSSGQLEVGTYPVSIGGIKNIETILSRPGQVGSHDFVGCIRSFSINNEDMLQATPTASIGVTSQCPRTSAVDVCQGHVCSNGGVCIPEWEGPACHCTPQYYGSKCTQELKPFGFGPDSIVKISPRESARRDGLVAAASRRRRATDDSSVFVRFRTTSANGVLLFTSTFGGSKYSVLSVLDGQLSFTINQYGASETISIATPTVADGNWHNASVTVSGSGFKLVLDTTKTESSSSNTFTFTSLDVKEITLGGAASAFTIDNKSLKDFDGCISVFQLDNKPLPMNGTTDYYNIVPVGGVENGCSSLCANNACDGQGCEVEGEVVVCAVATDDGEGLGVGIIIVIVFFVVLIFVIIIVFIVFRQRRMLCLKGKDHVKQNGNTLSKSANSSGHSVQDSGYGENNIDELIIRNHIAQELAGSKFTGRQNGHLMKPDIIETEVGRSPIPHEIGDGTVIIDNASDLTHLRGLDGEMPEHYDLENASSIAPSDIDVVDHYRHFHDGGKHRRKHKPSSSSHSHNNSQHSSKHYHGNHSNNNSHVMRDSPNLLTSVPYMNDLARGSPNARNSPINQINQLSRQSPNVRQSPFTHVNMHSNGMPITDLNTTSRTTSEHSLASHRSKNSSSTPHKPKRQMLPNGNPANSKKISNNNYANNNQFLTLEEVDRLNSRPRESPASLMEAFSTSSENNTRKMAKKPFAYQDTSVLLEPPESSSDDSANDSFTCSEFEYENDKQKPDFDPNSRIFSKLTEVENETEDGAYHNKNFNTDGLDSGGNSFSSNGVGSSDEYQSKLKPPNNAFNWDDLLNWGPKFEKLVGVFTDIALLPDADNIDFSELEGKMTDKEEYV